MPAQAGIQTDVAVAGIQVFWIPAFAGMTGIHSVSFGNGEIDE